MRSAMVAETIFSVFTFVGALVGLCTGAFTLWDRLTRGRPVAWLTYVAREGTGPNFTELSPKLMISNLTDFSIFILKISVTPDVYFLPKDFAIRSLVTSQTENPQYISVGPKASFELLISSRVKDGMPLDLQKQKVSFTIDWRRGDAPDRRRSPIVLKTNSELVTKMAKRGEFV
jgi:hypothetical protein